VRAARGRKGGGRGRERERERGEGEGEGGGEGERISGLIPGYSGGAGQRSSIDGRAEMIVE